MRARYLVVDEMDGVWGRADTPVEAEKIRREETEAVGDDRYRLRVVEQDHDHRPGYRCWCGHLTPRQFWLGSGSTDSNNKEN